MSRTRLSRAGVLEARAAAQRAAIAKLATGKTATIDGLACY